MPKQKISTIIVQGTDISILTKADLDYVSLTDMVRNFDGGSALIEQWLKNKDTVLFLGVWERTNNPDSNSLEFEGIRNQAGRNSFYLSSKKWIDATQAHRYIRNNYFVRNQFSFHDSATNFFDGCHHHIRLYFRLN